MQVTFLNNCLFNIFFNISDVINDITLLHEFGEDINNKEMFLMKRYVFSCIWRTYNNQIDV